MEEYRVLLVDDEEELREGIRRKIDWAGLGFVLAGTAGNGVDALELAEQLRPDVVLTDIKMPYMDGLELCGRLKPLLPAAKLVVFSGFDEFEYARQAVGMNVFEYILKPITAPELSGVLTRLREELDRERSERRDIEAIRRRYDESLPILRELFYTRLLDGRIPPDQVRDRAARYELQLPPGWWAAALVRADVPGRDGEAGRDELVLLSIQGFFQSRFAMEGCALHTVLYNDTVALLVRLEEEGRVYAFTEELGRLCRLAVPLLGMTLFAGVGRPSPQRALSAGASPARSASTSRWREPPPRRTTGCCWGRSRCFTSATWSPTAPPGSPWTRRTSGPCPPPSNWGPGSRWPSWSTGRWSGSGRPGCLCPRAACFSWRSSPPWPG